MLRSLKFRRALLAGFLGTAAMTLFMYGWPLIGLPRMDIIAALGGVFPFYISPYLIGTLLHVTIGISLALVYATFFDPWLPGPGWLRGALFSFVPWLFAITLLGPSLLVAMELFSGKEPVVANPCSIANPCAVANPCRGGDVSSKGPSPQVMSLIVHLLYGVVLGVAYRPSGT
ncbi:MAG: hypothetical protein HY695_38765 [Deltaproteobacteria bacterium]|nr:hypothetical protein [Deltaproteobacteria bacterium]